MTFEEFFKKKRIDLVALKAAEPGLLAEFEKHFAQMGEKSFDHTKKYWFNKLRLQYHLAPDQKPEKMHLENQLAEQTIVETLTESIPTPTAGFKPRFKPGMAGKQVSPTSDVKDPAPKDSATGTPEVNEAAATKDQNPPFQQDKADMQAAADATPRTTDGENDEKQIEASVRNPAGFKPRFNMKMTAGTSPQTKEFKQETEAENSPVQHEAPKQSEPVKPAGFKPRFNMKAMAPKPVEAEEQKTETAEQPTAEMTTTKEEIPATEEAPPAPKVGFKPRFNAKTTKQQPPQE
jgi:hypothetical protein